VSLDREQEGERRKRGSRHSSPSSEEVPSGRSRASVTRLSFPKPSASRRTTIFQHRSRPLRPSASSLAILEAVPPEAVAVAGVPMSSKMALFPAQVRPRPPPSNPARPRFTHPSQLLVLPTTSSLCLLSVRLRPRAEQSASRGRSSLKRLASLALLTKIPCGPAQLAGNSWQSKEWACDRAGRFERRAGGPAVGRRRAGVRVVGSESGRDASSREESGFRRQPYWSGRRNRVEW
jgi:hypothetical protein